jgi:hypothetical protein
MAGCFRAWMASNCVSVRFTGRPDAAMANSNASLVQGLLLGVAGVVSTGSGDALAAKAKPGAAANAAVAEISRLRLILSVK